MTPSQAKVVYYSTVFDESLVIERYMKKMVDVKITKHWKPWGTQVYWHRWRRVDCAALLRACNFRKRRVA